MVLAGSAAPEAARVAERLRSAVASRPFQLPNSSLRITISVGAAVRDNDQGESAAGLLQTADEALYRAKRNGRNRVEFAAQTREIESNIMVVRHRLL